MKKLSKFTKLSQALYNDIIVGYFFLKYVDHKEDIPSHFEISSIAVLNAYQGLKIGKALIDKINEVVNQHNDEISKDAKAKKTKKKATDIEESPSKSASFVSVKTPLDKRGFFEKMGYSLDKEISDSVAIMKKTYEN